MSDDLATDADPGPSSLAEAVSLEEIEQLIAEAAGTTGAAAPNPVRPGRSSGLQEFDFRRPNTFSREHVRALQIVHETFARQLGTVLSTTLRAVSQVTVASVQQITYNDYVASSANPTLLAQLSLEPLSGAGLLQVPLPLAMSILDRLLGGSGTGPYPARPLTDIEEGLIREVLERSLKELSSAFESLVHLQPSIVQLESNPQFAQVAAPSDMVVAVIFDTRIGGQEGQLSLCIPFASLQPALERVTGHSLGGDRRQDDLASAAVAMGLAMQDVPVDVSVRFTPVHLTSEEVVGLCAGDIVPLGHPADRPLALLAGAVVVLPAVAGRQGKRLACRIVDSALEGGS
ncbi:MAG: flagellar motor switch protein FliM [Acidimicrobiales bacterium]